MKAVILAGGLGTRLSEETHVKPKPMVEIGGRPILWHLFKYYSKFQINDFIVCCGYKGHVIKEYFANYFINSSDITVDMRKNKVTVHSKKSEPWICTFVDTGTDTLTGGRLKRVEEYLRNERFFCLTYGDGLSDINISNEINFHLKHKKLATMAGVIPPARFGAIDYVNEQVVGFSEKSKDTSGRINGGFFVLSPEVLKYIKGDDVSWEGYPLEKLASDNELRMFRHDGFWQPMDTLRDKNYLQSLWVSGKAPWKNWSDE